MASREYVDDQVEKFREAMGKAGISFDSKEDGLGEGLMRAMMGVYGEMPDVAVAVVGLTKAHQHAMARQAEKPVQEVIDGTLQALTEMALPMVWTLTALVTDLETEEFSHPKDRTGNGLALLDMLNDVPREAAAAVLSDLVRALGRLCIDAAGAATHADRLNRKQPDEWSRDIGFTTH